MYSQNLDVLFKEYENKDKCYQTKGKNPRCVFHLDMFQKTELL